MKRTLKGWLVDNHLTVDNKNDNIFPYDTQSYSRMTPNHIPV